MKYKVGDKVMVRSDLVVDWTYPKGECRFISSMLPFVGKEITIRGFHSSGKRYLIEGNSDYWTDEMLEDINGEFKLPEKWCVKLTEHSVDIVGRYYNKQANAHNYTTLEGKCYLASHDIYDGKSIMEGNCSPYFRISKPNSKYPEITFDQFKKYVLKESESTPVKEEVKFEMGKWYKYSAEYINHKTYAKYSSNQSVGDRFYYDEIITENNGFKKGHNWSMLTCKPVLLTDISEIQRYLPENHPDKIKKRTKKVEDLKYPDVVHCNSQQERNLLKNHIPKFDINNWTMKDPYLLIGGGCNDYPYEENTYTNYVNYEFSDIIFPEEEVVEKTDTKLSKEELLVEAKRRYPVGTKYKTAGDNSSGIFVLSSDDWSDSLLDDVVHAELGKGCLYYKGDWAEIISKPTVKEHPRYVECIGLEEVNIMFWRQNFTVGETYLVQEDDGTTTFKINGVWCDKSQFKPSTKEAFDKQSKSSVEEKEELVQTEMSQGQACNSCKYHDNCGTKGFFCNASGGQHYPKDNSSERYIVASDPFDAESSSDGIEVGKFPHVRDDVFKRMSEMNAIRIAPKLLSMGWICNPYNQSDCKLETIDSDEIHVPIIKTEVKQIKL